MVHCTLSALQSWTTISPSSVVPTVQCQQRSHSKTRWQQSNRLAQHIDSLAPYLASRKTLMASRDRQGHAVEHTGELRWCRSDHRNRRQANGYVRRVLR